MGRKSTKANKNIYQKKREALELSREQASELCNLSIDRIQDIENGTGAAVRPDEVLSMSDAYKYPNLCNHYCSKECAIGKLYVPEVELNLNLFEIIIKMVNSINKLDDSKERLVEIIADGLIDDSELFEFLQIQFELEQISISIEALQLWLEYQTDYNKIDKRKLVELKQQIWHSTV